MSDLHPCPLCGARADYRFCPDRNDSGHHWDNLVCNTCGGVVAEVWDNRPDAAWNAAGAYAAKLLAERDKAMAQWHYMRAENDRLRAALAMSPGACAYCQLPRDEMIKCRSGFPGCARADDMMGCPEFGAAMEADQLRAERDELAKDAARYRTLCAESAWGLYFIGHTYFDKSEFDAAIDEVIEQSK